MNVLHDSGPVDLWRAIKLLTVILGAALAVMLVFWQGLYGPFLLDDELNIPHARVSQLSADEVGNVLVSNTSGPLRRPVSILSFTLNHYFAGSGPFGFKYVNLLLHTLNGLLLFWLGGRLLQSLPEERRSTGVVWGIAGVAALVWALHPIHVSTVLYAVQRMAILAGTFDLAALLCYTVARQRLIDGSPGASWYAVLVVLFGLLSIFSKESGAALPFYILALELVVFRMAANDAGARRTLLVLLCVLCVVPIIAGVGYFFTHTDQLLSRYAFRDFDLLERLMTQPGVLLFYLKLILLPDVTQMSIFHDDYPVASFNAFTAIQMLLIPAALVAAIVVRHRLAIVSFAVLWFLASHVVESTVIPLELVFEHRNYLAAWGLLLPIAYYLVPPTVVHYKQRLRIAGVAAIALLLGFQTHTRARTWADPVLWVSTTAHEHPNSARARHTHALLLARQGRIEEALAEARVAEQLAEKNTGYTLAVLLAECATGNLSNDTVERLRNKLARQPLDTQTVQNLFALRDITLRKGCDGFDRNTLLSIAESALAFPYGNKPSLERAFAMGYYAIVLAQFPHRQPEVIDALNQTYREYPQDITPLVLLSELHLSMDNTAAARATLERAKAANARQLVDRSGLYADIEKRLAQHE
jgi:hypothetical protein